MQGSVGRKSQDPGAWNVVLKEYGSREMPSWAPRPTKRDGLTRAVEDRRPPAAEAPWRLREALLSYQSVLPTSILFPSPQMVDPLLRYSLLFTNPGMFHWAEVATMETSAGWCWIEVRAISFRAIDF